MQYSTVIRDAQNNAARDATGPTPTIEVWTGPEPVNCQAPDAGRLIARGALPVYWMQQSQDGVMVKSGEWLLTGQKDAGTGMAGGHFRIKSGDVCHWQGKFGKGQEMEPEENMVAAGQFMFIKTFSVKRGNG